MLGRLCLPYCPVRSLPLLLVHLSLQPRRTPPNVRLTTSSRRITLQPSRTEQSITRAPCLCAPFEHVRIPSRSSCSSKESPHRLRLRGPRCEGRGQGGDRRFGRFAKSSQRCRVDSDDIDELLAQIEAGAPSLLLPVPAPAWTPTTKRSSCCRRRRSRRTTTTATRAARRQSDAAIRG